MVHFLKRTWNRSPRSNSLKPQIANFQRDSSPTPARRNNKIDIFIASRGDSSIRSRSRNYPRNPRIEPKTSKMMHMTFYWGRQVTVLFDEWKTKTWVEYSITLLAVFLFAVFHEYILNLRYRFIEASKARKSSSAGLAVPLLGGRCRDFASKLSESILFGVNAGLGYLLMLAVMSFNGGVFIAIVLGFIVGYFFFRSDGKDEEINENACGCA